jgi:replicative DNA helicase
MATMDPRTPPQNLEAEQSVLGGVLLDNQSFDRVADTLSSHDFYRPAHAKIFNSMCELAKKSEPIDVITLTSKMKELGVFEEVGGAAYLAELLERVPTAIHSENYAKLVSEQAVKRRLITSCTEIAQRGFDPSVPSAELVDFAEREIFQVSSSKKSENVSAARDLVRSAFSELEKRFENQNDMTGTPSGWIELDKLTQGFQPSDLVVVACRPSMGKTSFSLGVARHAALHTKRPVLFFSLEMSKMQIIHRLLSSEGKVESTRIRSGKLTEQDWARLTRAAGSISEAPLYIDDTSQITALELRGKARRLKAQLGDIGLIVVDYLQIMGSPNKNENRERVISEISASLKALAKELQVPVLALAQLNRQIMLRQDKRPTPADLRESGAIEQDADLIIFIHRDEVEPLQPNTACVAEFIIGKHRNGPLGSVKVAWLAQYASFENLATNVPNM